MRTIEDVKTDLCGLCTIAREGGENKTEDPISRAYMTGAAMAYLQALKMVQETEDLKAMPAVKKREFEPKLYRRTCHGCGKEFETDSVSKRYCPACVMKMHEVGVNANGAKGWKAPKLKHEQVEANLQRAARIQRETGKSYGQQQVEKYRAEEERTRKARKGRKCQG